MNLKVFPGQLITGIAITATTINNAMRQNRELRKEKIFYDLIGCNEETEFKRILKLIL